MIIQVTRDELEDIVSKAVRAAMPAQNKTSNSKPHIKGIHELAIFLKVSPGRAQKLKNEGVFPYFQDGRLILFDPDKVQDAMAAFNKKKLK